jgi:hypothetical protein
MYVYISTCAGAAIETTSPNDSNSGVFISDSNSGVFTF